MQVEKFLDNLNRPNLLRYLPIDQIESYIFHVLWQNIPFLETLLIESVIQVPHMDIIQHSNLFRVVFKYNSGIVA